ncbi:MAG TPA: DNA translocase FtsK 4TM domain-containing protein [Bacilli bacterium]|mgnify:CR=1 FL=1|nr:DNA translocase FtsK 4TM domain-containing protein [Bacilli bacterium]
MAKKKGSKKKETEAKAFNYSVELNGLLLILIGLIGFGNFGPVGRLIKNFAIFLMGTWWVIILALLVILGAYMIIKRKLPKFFSSRLIGMYALVIVILIFSHIEYSGLPIKEILETTIENFKSSTSIINPQVGGGLIGALFTSGFSYLFDETGTKIVTIAILIFGIVMILDINLGYVFEKLGIGTKWLKKKLKVKKGAKLDDEELIKPDEPEDKIVITSVDELKSNPKQPVEQPTSNDLTPRVGEATNYQLPPLSLLDEIPKAGKTSIDFVKNNKKTVERVLNDFGVKGRVVEIHVGPSVTQFEVKIEAGTKVSKIVSIKDELKLALAVKEIRIQAPIPGKNTIGIEIPNSVTTLVRLKEILTNIPRTLENCRLLVVLGKDIMGRCQYADISRMPHLLVAGSTGSGKSVCMNSFIISLLMRYTPSYLKLVLIDPKKVEFTNYNGIPHLYYPVVTDPRKASLALRKIVVEMERRYQIFSETDAKNIDVYNDRIEKENRRNPDKPKEKMPYIVVIIDELADLMLIAAKEVEDSIMRITQMARAAGIHLIVATQRPSTDVITGVVKNNITTRIAFTVTSNVDSRTILDMSGAEKLIGKGDMLYKPVDENTPIRIQGSYISDDEIRRVVDFVSKEQKVNYVEEDLTPISKTSSVEVEEYDDPLYNEIVEFSIKTGKVSASLLQRRFRLGYNRAARIIDLLEERGIVGPMNGSKPREVLVKLEEKE